MRILTIMTTPFALNGITNVVKTNYTEIDKNKFDMDFIFLNKPDEDFLHYITENGGNSYITPHRRENIIKYIRELHKIFKNESYDIVHAHGNSTTLTVELVMAKLHKIPVRIAHAHSTSTKFPKIHSFLRPLFNRSYTAGFSVSNESGKWLFNNEEYYLVENGIDVEKFKFNESLRISSRIQYRYKAENFVIGNVGRFSSEKNQEYLIYLLHDLIETDDHYRLLLVGDGYKHPDYQNLVRELNLEKYVQFTGNIESIHPLLSAMDVMVVPSLYEGLGITVIEGQAADLKVLASTNIPKEVDITGNVTFFELDNINNLKDKIRKLRQQKQDRSKLVLHNQMLASDYTIENSIKKLECLYQKLLKIATI